MSAAARPPKPEGYAGLRETRWNREAETWVSLYDGEPAGMDTDGGRWQTVCEKHGHLVSHATLALARSMLTEVTDWCEECQPRAALTLADLERALDDERHLGFGYSTRRYIEDAALVARLDGAVLDVANELGLDYDDLFHWTNSKHGRWLVDHVEGRSGAPSPETVREHLNRSAVADAKAA